MTMDGQKRFARQRPVGFLLAQLGSHAAGKFADRLAPFGLKPSDAGILRMLSHSEGLSQQDLAGRLRINPSRLVSLVDVLEERGLVERRGNEQDRRTYALHLTATGRRTLEDVGRAARAHNDELCRALTAEEREQLTALLARIADDQGLSPGVHPGYRAL